MIHVFVIVGYSFPTVLVWAAASLLPPLSCNHLLRIVVYDPPNHSHHTKTTTRVIGIVTVQYIQKL